MNPYAMCDWLVLILPSRYLLRYRAYILLLPMFIYYVGQYSRTKRGIKEV